MEPPFFIIDTQDKHEQDETEEEERNKEQSLQWDLIDEMVNSLGRAWPMSKATQGTRTV